MRYSAVARHEAPTIRLTMRKALLLYNPLSGRRRDRRFEDVQSALRVLQRAGVDATAAATIAAGPASEQVQQAIAEGCDTVFACGGDGTVHDVLQALVGTGTALGIIPLGTANVLAHDLGLPSAPSAAAQAALRAKPRRIAVGRLDHQDFDGQPALRYFIVTAGIGADAYLFYKLDVNSKQTLGLAAYYVKATELWLTHKMKFFQVNYAEDGQRRRAETTQLLAVRIADFGDGLRKLAPGASLLRDDLRLVLFQTRSRSAYLRYVVRGLIGANWRVPGIDLAYSQEATCTVSQDGSGTQSRIFVEADGELLGTLPAGISIVPDALTLLVPESFG
jgi:YegS/Rv2252/BmrU family lipid kinase